MNKEELLEAIKATIDDISSIMNGTLENCIDELRNIISTYDEAMEMEEGQ